MELLVTSNPMYQQSLKAREFINILHLSLVILLKAQSLSLLSYPFNFKTISCLLELPFFLSIIKHLFQLFNTTILNSGNYPSSKTFEKKQNNQSNKRSLIKPLVFRKS